MVTVADRLSLRTVEDISPHPFCKNYVDFVTFLTFGEERRWRSSKNTEKGFEVGFRRGATPRRRPNHVYWARDESKSKASKTVHHKPNGSVAPIVISSKISTLCILSGGVSVSFEWLRKLHFHGLRFCLLEFN